jgi:hypothetical protein
VVPIHYRHFDLVAGENSPSLAVQAESSSVVDYIHHRHFHLVAGTNSNFELCRAGKSVALVPIHYHNFDAVAGAICHAETDQERETS